MGSAISVAEQKTATTRRGALARRTTALLVTALMLSCCASTSAVAADPFGPLDAPAFQTSYSDEVLADSPVAYWRLGESSGPAMTDVTGANNGTYTGGVTLGQPGAFPFDSNTAVTFNGTTGRASAPDSNSLDRTGAVTVELWVKRTKSAAYQVVVGKPGNGQSRFENYAIWFNTSNRAQAYFGNGTTFVNTVSAVVDTNWHHIAATYDNAVARIYIDGVQSGQASSTVALTPNQLPLNVARENNNQYYFGGTLDEVAIYPTALSAARLQAHHAKAAADVTPPAITLTQPVNGSSTNDTTPSLAGIAGSEVGDSTTVTARVYEGAGTSGPLLHSLSATRGAGGFYTGDSPALTDGTYTARAEQGDSGGNTGFSALSTFTVDTVAPGTSITSGPADPTGSTSASLVFTSEAGAGFECKLDAGSYAACTSPQAYSGLGEGSHTFSVRASDIAGNTGPVAVHTWAVDTAGPSTTITNGPADPTSSTSASLEFSSEAGATFECKLDAGSYAACTSPKLYSGLGEGSHTFSVRATDPATNTGAAATRTWTIDTTAPVLTITAPPNGSSTNDTTPSLAGVAGTAIGDSASITVRVYAGATATGTPIQTLNATRGAGGDYAVAPAVLATGVHTAQAEQSDSAGNSGLSTTTTFTIDPLAVDTDPPVVSLTAPVDGSVTNDATPSFAGVAGVAAGDSSTVTVLVHAGPTVLDPVVRTLPTTRGAGGSYTVAASPALTDGTYTARAEQTDTGGNTGFSAATTFTVDTAGPSTTITNGPADPTSSTSASLEFSSEAGATFECKLDAGSYAACTSPKLYSGLGEGSHTFSVRATDPATNTGAAATRTWTIDTTAPVLTITAPPNGSSTNDTTPSLAGVAGTAIGDSASITVRVYAGATATGTPIQTLNATRGAGGVYAVDAAALTNGTYTARASQSDTSGNSGQSGTTTFTIDTTAPTVTLTSPANGSSSSSSTPSFSGVASSAAGDSASVTVRIYSGGTPTGTPVQTLSATRGAGGAYSVSSSALAQGAYTARAEQIDAAGNSGLSSANTFTITISTPDPVLIGAGDIAGCGSSEGGAGTAALIQQNPTATVFTLGDNAYPSGQPSQYTNCYGSSWGAFKSRTRPITGGHDTETVSGGTLPNQGFSDYFSAQLAPFGPTATDRLKAYYSYDIGAWHVVMLNSACYYDLPGCNVAQQEQWFRDDLAANDEACTAVMWHDSRWSSGNIHGNEDFTQPLWQIAYEGGADVVLGGNEHDYERFAPQDATGALDNQFGIRSFVVGTGGYYLYDLGTLKPNSQAFSSTYGVMKLTLHSTSYDWQFLPVAGETFTDSGTGNCHGKPSPPPGTPTVRSSASNTASHPSTALTVAKPAGTISGDVLVATIGYQTGSARNVAPPTGWTAVPNTHFFDGGNAGIRAFYRVAGASEPASYTFALTGGSGQAMGGGVMSLIGADPLAPINASGGQTSGGANVSLLTAPSITTTKPNTALIYSGAVNQPVTWAAPQLMPELWDVDTSGTYNIGTSAAVGGVAAAGPTGTRAATILPLARGVAISIAIAGP